MGMVTITPINFDQRPGKTWKASILRTLNIYLPYQNFTQSALALKKEHLHESKTAAYHTIRFLQCQHQKRHYQLSGSDKGTIVSTRNSCCVAHGNLELVDLWEHYLDTLKLLYNTLCLLTNSNEPLFKFYFPQQPSWLTEEFCEENRRILSELDLFYVDQFSSERVSTCQEKSLTA